MDTGSLVCLRTPLTLNSIKYNHFFCLNIMFLMCQRLKTSRSEAVTTWQPNFHYYSKFAKARIDFTAPHVALVYRKNGSRTNFAGLHMICAHDSDACYLFENIF